MCELITDIDGGAAINYFNPGGVGAMRADDDVVDKSKF